jgi:NAD(P)-dependent dehydrogenase (short-subunit alcohol dehydrogenase family)
MDLGLRDRVALVTGGSRGIGLAAALALTREGCRVLIAARGEAGLADAADVIRTAGGLVTTVVADMMGKATPPAPPVAEALAAFGRLDIVVANTGGIVGSRDLTTSTSDEWKRTQRDLPEAFASFEQNEFPRGRLSAVEEIANALEFLTSPRAMGINAADLQVDGGQRRPSLR